MAIDDTPTPTQSPSVNPKGGLFGGPVDPSDLDPNVRAVIDRGRWTTEIDGSEPAATILYAFPTQLSDFGHSSEYLFGFAEATENQKVAVRTALSLVSSYTQLTFVEASSATADAAAIRVAQTSRSNSSVAYLPFPFGIESGDTFLSPANGDVLAQFFGSDPFLTVTHELGHALGLKHGQRPAGYDRHRRLLAAELHDVRHRGAAIPVRRQLRQCRNHRCLYLGRLDRPAVHQRLFRSRHRRQHDRQDLLDRVDPGRHRHLRPQQLQRRPGRRPAAWALA